MSQLVFRRLSCLSSSSTYQRAPGIVLSAHEHVLHDPGSPHTTSSPSKAAAEKRNLRRWAAGVDGRDRSAAAAAAAGVCGAILRSRRRCRTFSEMATSKSSTYGWDCALNEAYVFCTCARDSNFSRYLRFYEPARVHARHERYKPLQSGHESFFADRRTFHSCLPIKDCSAKYELTLVPTRANQQP